MKTILFTLSVAFLPLQLLAQINADDKVIVEQKSNKYPGVDIRSYESTPGVNGGHTFLVMRHFGGTLTAPKATPGNRLLGTVIYSGHDGSKSVQVGRISVRTSGTFSAGNHPAKMNFRLGGSAACCGATRMTIDGTNGNVGIGTESPRNKLDVNGTVRSREVRVEASPWPDYVFEEGYALTPLEATEKFIKENKHLPNIPSAQEVEREGIALGEMNARLLRKIEEMTLHLIAIQKQVNGLQKANAGLSTIVKSQQTEILSLKDAKE